MFPVFQLYLEGYDSARPNNRAQALLQVSVNRNPAQPSFPGSGASYDFTILESEAVGYRIFSFSATDSDGVSTSQVWLKTTHLLAILFLYNP